MNFVVAGVYTLDVCVFTIVIYMDECQAEPVDLTAIRRKLLKQSDAAIVC
ncbi:hypothetical protein VIMS_04169 [Mycobacterium marinum]|nr:hypothetical protein VIMS_04169 [Mycobacterium marinum]